jgi:hypothetical protein
MRGPDILPEYGDTRLPTVEDKERFNQELNKIIQIMSLEVLLVCTQEQWNQVEQMSGHISGYYQVFYMRVKVLAEVGFCYRLIYLTVINAPELTTKGDFTQCSYELRGYSKVVTLHKSADPTDDYTGTITNIEPYRKKQ